MEGSTRNSRNRTKFFFCTQILVLLTHYLAFSDQNYVLACEEIDLAAKYLGAQISFIEKMREVTNIEIPLGVIEEQGLMFTGYFNVDPALSCTGLRHPVYAKPFMLLSEFTKSKGMVYENRSNLKTDADQSMNSIFSGIASGLSNLHRVRFGLTTKSVIWRHIIGRGSCL